MLCGKFPLRIYCEKNKEITRWYFGYPKELIDPIKDLLGTSCYWDENFDKEDGKFYLVYAGVIGDEFDPKKLTTKMDFNMKLYNMCLNTYKKMSENALKKIL